MMETLSWVGLFLLLIILAFFIYAGRAFAVWVPTRRRDWERVAKIINPRPGEVFYELGCGDGRVTAYFARHYGVKAVGVEIQPLLFLTCLLRKWRAALPNLQFKFKNLFKEDLTGADIVYLYGLPHALRARVREKLERELKPGARVASYVFKIKGWQPAQIFSPTQDNPSVYLYVR